MGTPSAACSTSVGPGKLRLRATASQMNAREAWSDARCAERATAPGEVLQMPDGVLGRQQPGRGRPPPRRRWCRAGPGARARAGRHRGAAEWSPAEGVSSTGRRGRGADPTGPGEDAGGLGLGPDGVVQVPLAAAAAAQAGPAVQPHQHWRRIGAGVRVCHGDSQAIVRGTRLYFSPSPSLASVVTWPSQAVPWNRPGRRGDGEPGPAECLRRYSVGKRPQVGVGCRLWSPGGAGRSPLLGGVRP
ncbi:hypothetical protein DV517_00030 [Streptomyces sp. S816]|nr:hypothetical protein DV517_00030 [Streptomyces sp. S816]